MNKSSRKPLKPKLLVKHTAPSEELSNQVIAVLARMYEIYISQTEAQKGQENI